MERTIQFVTLLCFFAHSCTFAPPPPTGGEELAQRHCASCHRFPDPAELDKTSWEKGVLPEMGLRLGLRDLYRQPFPGYSQEEVQRCRQAGIFPDIPVLPQVAWDSIQAFYLRLAPDSLPAPLPFNYPALSGFEALPVRTVAGDPPLVTLLKYEKEEGVLWIGDLQNRLFTLSAGLQVQARGLGRGPFAEITAIPAGDQYLLSMGKLNPNDLLNGQLLQRKGDGSEKVLIDSLGRPVHFLPSDLNQDGLEDFIICQHGHYLGELAWYEGRPDGGFTAHQLLNIPGARKTEVHDFNRDGRPDIIALLGQGNEGFFLFTNQGEGRFKTEKILDFSPLYGSSYFECVDYEGDGDLDLLYSNGDNADYSAVPKPYHGLRLFINDGAQHFTQAWFFPFNGASQLRSGDFDQDGDLDIAAIAFFPDLKRGENSNFVYLENQDAAGFRFQPYALPEAATGNWLVMESGDFDQDGDLDLALGSNIYTPANIPAALQKYWREEGPEVLVLVGRGAPGPD